MGSTVNIHEAKTHLSRSRRRGRTLPHQRVAGLMLLALADVEGHPFLTADPRLLALDLPWVIDATA